MATRQANPIPLHLPPDIDLDSLPRHVTAIQGQEILSRYYGAISARTIRYNWPLQWRVFNGRKVTDTRNLIAEAERRFEAAPVAASGRTTELTEAQA